MLRRQDENRQRVGATLVSMADECEYYYNLLLTILEAPVTPAEARDLVWEVLMQLPTLRVQYSSIEHHHFTRWSSLLGPDAGPWRSLYALQIVDAMLLPGDNDAGKLRRAVEWRRRFLVTGGLEQLVAFAMTVDKHPSWHDRQPLARSVCLPLLARILKSCVAGALSDLKSPQQPHGAGAAAGGASCARSVPPSPGSRPPSSPVMQPADLPLAERQGGGGAAAAVGGGGMVIDMGLMTRQLLSFLLQDYEGDSEEKRVAHMQALTDGLSVIRQLLCAGVAGTLTLLQHAAASGVSITIGSGIIDTFFSKGCADDLIDVVPPVDLSLLALLVRACFLY